MSVDLSTDFRRIDAEFDVTPVESPGVDVRVSVNGRSYYFASERNRRGWLRGLRLEAVERDDGSRLDHDNLGTMNLPPELVRFLRGATYRHTGNGARRGLENERTIAKLVHEDCGRWVAFVKPGEGVLHAVRDLLVGAAEGRIVFETFRTDAD